MYKNRHGDDIPKPRIKVTAKKGQTLDGEGHAGASTL